MESLQDILSHIEEKVKKMALERVDLEEESIRKDALIESYKSRIEELQEQNKQLKEQEKIYKSNNINNKSDIAETKTIINELIKKIDSSISIVSSVEKCDVTDF